MKRKRVAGEEKVIQFWNCFLIKNHEKIKDDLWIRDGKILDPHVLFFDEHVAADVKIDCKGLIIAPGYIDVQINGGFGVDFSSDIESIETGIGIVCEKLLQYGVTSFCPTIVTSAKETYHQLLPRIANSSTNTRGATVLGLHLEGPFINKEKKGAHKELYIEALDSQGINKMIEHYGTLNFVKIVTMAPEQPFALKTIEDLTTKGITVSIGHTMGCLDIAADAANCGARFITHLFNAMLPFHHRDPGVVGLLTSTPQDLRGPIYFGIIADGNHTHPTAVRIAHRSHPEGLVLVSDAIAALGLRPGKHCLGTVEVEIHDGKATVAGLKTLAGSIASLDYCVRQFKEFTGCSKVQALEAASLHPAQLLQISDRKGTLNYGADADIIMLNDDLEVQATFIAGNLEWLNDSNAVVKQVFKDYEN